nr:cytokinin riboside 5'-monophosphate phosphoribohydrolase LOG5-like [Tanacetum cinerariifolium]
MCKELTGETIGEVKAVSNMHERKAEMARHSDCFIALPGGYGTLEELLEVITWAQLGIHDKPVGLLNVDGYYNSLLTFIDKAVDDGFIMPAQRHIIVSAPNAKDLVQKLEDYVPMHDGVVAKARWEAEQVELNASLYSDSGNLYPVTKPPTYPIAFLSTSAFTWHQRLGHPVRAIYIQLSSRQLLLLLLSRQVLSRGINASDIQRFAGYATRVGFYHSRYDSSLFIYRQGSQVAYLLIYVDDIILTASYLAILQQIIGSLNNEFDMTDLEALNYFLGISADRTLTNLFLSQKKYALQLLERAHMVTCNPSWTPVDTESKLGPKGILVQDPTLYHSLAGGLQYLSFARLDLSYAIQQICLYMHDPMEPHFVVLKRILRYVRGTLDFGLHLYVSATTPLVGYTDAD